MKLCILDNDTLDPSQAPLYGSYALMLERLMRGEGAQDWEIDIFHTPSFAYPASFADYDAVLLTGSKSDSFSDEPWVVELRNRVTALLETDIKLLGVCFGHQLIALCMGAKVGRAPQGWSSGNHTYRWTANDWSVAPHQSAYHLLASHQDQVLELPPNTTLLAQSDNCPVAAYARGKQVLCIQPHPEFVEDYSAYILNKRRHILGEPLYQAGMDSLAQGQDGKAFARLMVAFAEAA
jgi:GMP synthase-like glutamine amidotransferase